MQSSRTATVAAVAGLLGAAGAVVWLSSRRGEGVRAAIQERFRSSTKHLESQLKAVEAQLHDLEQYIQESRKEFANRFQAGMSGEAGSEEQNWSVDSGDVVRELPHLPRR